jgi:abortive infection bacteriophage resistance protein
MTLKIYEKPPLTIEQQIALLKSRGLVFDDTQQVSQHLQFISYYRLCGYALEFEEKHEKLHRYKSGTTFEQVLDRYVFDRKLRLLVIDAIERIEVAVRTVMTNQLALRHGSHWYMKSNLFLPRFNHNIFLQTIHKEITPQEKTKQKKCEQFIQTYYDNYTAPKLPPTWMVAEILSLGTWSILFPNLIEREDQKVISHVFELSYSGILAALANLLKKFVRPS